MARLKEVVVSRLGVVLPPDLPSQEVRDFIREADELGFDELWVVEDCFLRGGIAQAAVALASTDRIHVGIGILPAGARNPAFAAMELATLADLFPGRVTVGVGHGMPDWMRQVGAWPASPVTLLREHLTALRRLLHGDRVTSGADGANRYVQLRDVQLAGPPAELPLVFAGVRGEKSLDAVSDDRRRDTSRRAGDSRILAGRTRCCEHRPGRSAHRCLPRRRGRCRWRMRRQHGESRLAVDRRSRLAGTHCTASVRSRTRLASREQFKPRSVRRRPP